MKRISIFFVLFIFVFVVGCNHTADDEDDDVIAFISKKQNSSYEQVIRQLFSGYLSDYHVKFPYADESWIKIWAEAYIQGERVESFPSIDLTFGLNPNPLEEGPIGVAMLNGHHNKKYFLVYSPNVRTGLIEVEDDEFFMQNEIDTWSDNTLEDTVKLNSGEAIILAAYRQSENALRSGYDFQDEQAVEEMIASESRVLIFKLQVTKDRSSEIRRD